MARNSKAYKRLVNIILVFILVASGIAISLYFASDNIVFFIKPSELTAEHLGKRIRVGGLVEHDSITKMPDRVTAFNITDNTNTISVVYRGIVPTLFREGQGIVAEGMIMKMNGQFVAEKLLTKHDENYKPPESK